MSGTEIVPRVSFGHRNEDKSSAATETRLLRNRSLRPCSREGFHVLNRSGRRALHLWELRAQVLRETLNDPAPDWIPKSPASLSLRIMR